MWLLKIEPNAWAGGCAVCVDLQAVRTLEFFGELHSLAKGFGPIVLYYSAERNGTERNGTDGFRAAHLIYI